MTAAAATLNGVVDPQGQDTQYTFWYARQDVDGSPDPSTYSAPLSPGSVAASAGPTSVSVTVSGLLPGTIYHVHLSATNASGPAVGADVTFATRPVAPQVGLSTPANITDTSAILLGSIVQYGVPVHYHYEYGPTTSYGMSAPLPDAEADPTANCSVPTLASTPDYHATIDCFDLFVRTVQQLTGLTPGTTYHYRLVASNVVGETTSPDATFTTTGTAPVAPPPAPPAPTVHQSNGRLQLAVLTHSATVSRRGRTTLLILRRGNTGRCRDTLELVVTRRGPRHHRRTVLLARTRVSLNAGALERVTVTLNATGARLLSQAHGGRLSVRATADGISLTVTLRRS